jgi:putative addiction module component (TIGR02574 family)
MTRIIEEVLKLSVPERILMVEAIWDSIEEKDELLEINEATKVILDERLKAHENNPLEGSSWTDVKARIKKQL